MGQLIYCSARLLFSLSCLYLLDFLFLSFASSGLLTRIEGHQQMLQTNLVVVDCPSMVICSQSILTSGCLFSCLTKFASHFLCIVREGKRERGSFGSRKD